MGRWPADNVGPTKHPSAFRLNKKELAEIADAAAKVEADALEQGVAAEEAKVMGEAKKRELTKQKQEERWRRSREKHAGGTGVADGDVDGGDAGSQAVEPADEPTADELGADEPPQEPAELQEPVRMAAAPAAAAETRKAAGTCVAKAPEHRKSSGSAAAASASSGSVGRVPTSATNNQYYVMLGDAMNQILNHRIFKGILDADPMEISADLAKSSGVQARNPHVNVCFGLAPTHWTLASATEACCNNAQLNTRMNLHCHSRQLYQHLEPAPPHRSFVSTCRCKYTVLHQEPTGTFVKRELCQHHEPA